MKPAKIKKCIWNGTLSLDLRLALLYKIVTGHVAINPDQIGLVAADNRTRENHRYKFRAIGASLTGLCYSFAVRTVSDWNQLPAVVVEQENPAAFKAQLARSAPIACHNPLPTPLACNSMRRSADHRTRQEDKTGWVIFFAYVADVNLQCASRVGYNANTVRVTVLSLIQNYLLWS